MATRKKKYITAKEVSKLLKINSELITYLRQNENLPFIKDNKYILFSEAEIIRWRNKHLLENSKPVMNLKDYWQITKLFRFINYDDFKIKATDVVFLDGDIVIQYLKRQNPEKEIVDLVGDIVFAYWDNKKPKCENCGRTIVSNVSNKLCTVCRDNNKK